MKALAAFFCVLFLANNMVADPYSMAIQRAKNVSANETRMSDETTNQDNSPPSPPPVSAAATKPVPPQDNPALEATLRNISNLRVDFDALGKLSELKSDSLPKKLLVNDLTAAAQGAKPPENSVSKLADSLATAVAGKAAMKNQHQKLAQDVHAIFNSSHLSAEQQKTISADVRKILQDGGASPDETTNVVGDIQTIASQTK
jgi:hypothetical protein